MNDTTTTPRPRSRWGRAWFGGGSGVLLTVSLVLGALLAAGIGALLAMFEGKSNPWLAFGIGAVVTLPTACALVWAIFVDRSTLRGAVDRPEESAENAWYDQAAAGAFNDLILVLGLGAGAFPIFGFSVPASTLLMALVLLAAVDFGLRYWVASRAGR
ncbi:MAG: hypothetical protein QM619_05300 [Micropruina sp.]|uniref:hypothetical protein n=1 Tax=Micropruina sp. TaxID=2737536 RepID=UPI0039E30CCB